MSKICHDLHQRVNELKMFRFPLDSSQLAQIPRNGIYVLFEDGETAHGINRIVRVGTHTGENQLQSRLKQHFVKANKDRSIFRKNIGRCMLNRDRDFSFLTHWDIDLTTRVARSQDTDALRKRREEIENRVSEYMQKNFWFVLFSVPDKLKRLEWESKIISTVSRCSECSASNQWLGQYSPKTKIKESSMWLVNELNKLELSPTDLDELSNTGIRPDLSESPSLYNQLVG